MRKSLNMVAGVVGAVIGVPFLVACGAGPGSSEEGEPIGEASLQLTTVPTGATCLQVVGTGASAFNVTSALTAGASSASIALSRLPLGTSSVTANVYGVACSGIAGVQPTWVADPQTVTFRAGVPANISLTFRQLNPLVVSANFVGNITDLNVGYFTAGLVLSDGTVRTAGSAAWAWTPLPGNKTFMNPGGFSGIAAIAVPRDYFAHGCARTTSGTVQCFGSNPSGALGPNVALGATSGPVAIPNVTGVTRLGVGSYHSCVIADGNVMCWGLNSSGQLGNGSTANSTTPAWTGLGVVSELAVGANFTCASSNGLSCWGDNSYGQLGDGTTTQRLSPTWTSLTGIVSLSAGRYHTCAVRADGTIRCWGYNGTGALGDGTFTNRLVPTQVPGINDAVDVACGEVHTCARHKDGTVSCWGSGGTGALGNGAAEASRPTWAKVPGLTGVVKISSGYNQTCALTDSQQVLCWGSDELSQGGDGLLTEHYVPTPAIIQ